MMQLYKCNQKECQAALFFFNKLIACAQNKVQHVQKEVVLT